MTHRTLGRPAAGEFIPYYQAYIMRVPDGDVADIPARQATETLAFAATLAPVMARRRATAERWSALQVFGHTADAERVFSYRALRFARGVQTPQLGVDLDAFASERAFDRRSLVHMAEDFAAVWSATAAPFRGFETTEWSRTGLADGERISVRALAYVLAGHEARHSEELRTPMGVRGAAMTDHARGE